MRKILLFALIGLIGASCAKSRLVVTKTNSKKHEIETSYNGMLSKPILADLNIENQRKEIVYEGKLNLSMADLKLNAKQKFLEAHSCDFVVDPIYSTTVVKENLKTKEIKIKLTGLPAKYSNIYQVDSLPRSISQFYSLDNPIKRVEYTNSIDEYNPKIGVDLTMGTFKSAGIQIDYPFQNEIFRGYASFENYRTPQIDLDYTIDSVQSGVGVAAEYNTASVGIMKEFQLINRVKIRGQAGLNYSLFDGIDGSVNSISRLGIRLGGGLDLKLYRGISLLVKGHSNLNFINIYDKDSSIQDSKIKDLNITTPAFYISYGLRFVF